MDRITIRRLRADEIECRVAQVGKTQKGQVWCSMLLYKDARVDQKILDEVFGITGWKRSHKLIGDRLYCTVSVWDEEKKEWISKQDVGTESYTEKEKGQASDAFKRACFNVGIGRELYTAPKIFVTLTDKEYSEDKGKIAPRINLTVSKIEYNKEGQISFLVLVDDSLNVRFKYGVPLAGAAQQPVPQQPAPQPTRKEMSDKQLQQAIDKINEGKLDILDKCKATYALKDFQLHAMSEAVMNYKINNNIQ